MKRIITLSGIGEESSSWSGQVPSMLTAVDLSDTGPVAGMWKFFTDALALNPDQGFCQQFNWQDQYGPAGGDPFGTAYANNINGAAQALHDYVMQLPGGSEVVLCGYSGGGHVVSLAAPMIEASIASGFYPAGSGGGVALEAIVFAANPARALGDSNVAIPNFGIAGPRQKLRKEVVCNAKLAPADIAGRTLLLDIANDQDVIPCCPPNPADNIVYPMRAFYALTDEFSLTAFPQWGQDAIQWLLSNMLFQGHGIDAWPLDWFVCAQYVYGYLFGGQHTTYYQNILPGYAPILASMLGL